jgi:hypothetical protein
MGVFHQGFLLKNRRVREPLSQKPAQQKAQYLLSGAGEARFRVAYTSVDSG